MSIYTKTILGLLYKQSPEPVQWCEQCLVVSAIL